MGRRTIAGYELTLHRWRKPDEHACPADLNGESLQDIFARWAEGLTGEGVLSAGGQSFFRVVSVKRYNEHIVVVDTLSGKAGEEGEVYDTASGESRYTLTDKDVPTSGARAILICPPRGEVALWFSEYSARSSGASLLLGRFEIAWNTFETGFTFRKDRLIAAEIALHDGIVTEVEVRLKRRADDLADGVKCKAWTVSHKYKPAKGSLLRGNIIDKIRRNRKEAYELVEIPGSQDDSDSEIFVSVNVDGHTRKVDIFKPDDGVYFREELNAFGRPILTDDQIIAYCAREAETFLERLGFDWDDSWARRG